MYINGIKQLAKSLGGFIQKNSPTILTSLGVGGLLTTVILAIRATPKAIMLLEDKRYEAKLEDPDFDDFSKIGIFRTVWTCYIPTIAVGAA